MLMYIKHSVMQNRKTTSLKIDEKVWRIARKKAIDLSMDVSDYVENLIRADNKLKPIEVGE